MSLCKIGMLLVLCFFQLIFWVLFWIGWKCESSAGSGGENFLTNSSFIYCCYSNFIYGDFSVFDYWIEVKFGSLLFGDLEEQVKNWNWYADFKIHNVLRFGDEFTLYFWLIDWWMYSEWLNCFRNVNEQTRVLLQNQQLLYNGKEVRNSEKLSALGVKDDDLIMMVSNAGSRYSWAIHCLQEPFIVYKNSL